MHDEPRAWRNTETDTILCVRYNDEEEYWEVTGQNSRLYPSTDEGEPPQSLEEAKELACDYMRDHPSPSPMV